jgi:hypothetical protein
MSLAALMQSAATSAQRTLAQLGGAAAGAMNVLGPDGVKYLGVFRAANAFESAAVGAEMQAHGFTDAEVVILSMTRSQFSTVPLAWRRQQLSRLDLSPAVVYRIHSVGTADSLHYSFTLLSRQGKA